MDIAVANQPVMAVAGIGIQRHVAENADLRHSFLDRAHAAADRLSALTASRPSSLFRAGSVEGKSAITGMPSPAASSAAATARSVERRSTPGMDATASRLFSPSITKNRPDQIRRRQCVFGHQPPRPVVAAQSAHTHLGIASHRCFPFMVARPDGKPVRMPGTFSLFPADAVERDRRSWPHVLPIRVSGARPCLVTPPMAVNLAACMKWTPISCSKNGARWA